MEILVPIFGIFTSFILLYYLSALNRSNIFLALFFLCCNLIVLVYYGLHFTHNLFWEGFCFIHFLPLSFLLGPLLFYYVKSTLTDGEKFSKWDYLHLIPAFLMIFVSLPFTTLPFNEKARIAKEIVEITNNYNVKFNWVSFEFILFARSIHLFLYSILAIGYFFWSKQQLMKKYNAIPSNNPVIQRWFLILAFIQIIIACNSIGHMTTLYGHGFTIFNIKSSDIFNDKYYFRICGGGFFIQNFILFLFPKVLYGNISYTVEVKNENIFQEIKSNMAKKIKPSSLGIEGDLDVILKEYLSQLPFINKGFSLSQMSFDLKIPERFLSNYFNKELSITFSEWKKNLRIDYVCKLIEEGNAKNITIEAISTNAGFVSRSKFIDAFKERKGVTPSAFIKSQLNN